MVNVMKPRISSITLAAVALLCVFARSTKSSDAYWDEGFGTPGTDLGGVAELTRIGRELYAGGNFVSIGGIAATDIAKWDGARWTDVGSGQFAGNVIYAIAAADGRLFVGGLFSSIGGVAANNIAKWDGEKWSAMGDGLEGEVLALGSVGDEVYAGGAVGVVKWDGKAWSPLGGGVSKPSLGNAIVLSLAVVSPDEIYVGGVFTRAGEVEVNNAARWDGTGWHALGGGVWRNTDGPLEGRVETLASNGKELFVGGEIRFAGGIPVRNLARWDGAQWHSMGEVGEFVQDMVLDGNSLYVVGNFSEIGGIAARRIARWDGANWFPLGSGINSGGPTSLAVANGRLYVGGQFTMVGNKPATNIALWHIPRTLATERVNDQLHLSWPKADSNLVLQSCVSLTQSQWQTVATPPTLQNNRLTVTEPITSESKFYRLAEPQ